MGYEFFTTNRGVAVQFNGSIIFLDEFFALSPIYNLYPTFLSDLKSFVEAEAHKYLELNVQSMLAPEQIVPRQDYLFQTIDAMKLIMSFEAEWVPSPNHIEAIRAAESGFPNIPAVPSYLGNAGQITHDQVTVEGE